MKIFILSANYILVFAAVGRGVTTVEFIEIVYSCEIIFNRVFICKFVMFNAITVSSDGFVIVESSMVVNDAVA